MPANLLWLSTSLFCCKSNWNYIFKEIESLLSGIADKKYTSVYLIEFNYLCGENIRFALLCKKEDAESLAKHVDHYFKIFFSKSNFPETDKKLPVDGMFMPFPVNTIQYGLYKPIKINNANELSKYNPQIALAQIILEAFQEDEINEETIVTFAFYLNMTLISMIIKDQPAATEELLKFYTRSDYSNSDISNDFLILKFEENKVTLQEIFHDILNGQQLPEWVIKWMKICATELENNNLHYSNNEFNYTAHSRIVYIINKHLGINKDMGLLLSYFIERVLKVASY